MDKEVLRAKLEALIRCVHRIKDQNISTFEELDMNLDKQEIIILNLQRAVQICVDIGNHILLDYPGSTPSTMSETFINLAKNGIISEQNATDLKHAVGFRNIAVHQYENINTRIVFEIVTKHLDDFKAFAESIYGVI